MTNSRFEFIINEEGVYSNDKTDYGGETIYGIAYRYNKTEPIFKQLHKDKITHKLRTNHDIRKFIENNSIYYKMAFDYYDKLFKRYHLDLINSDDVQTYLFSTGVNIGMRLAIKMAQRAVGATDDGIIGKNSALKMNWVIKKYGSDNLKERISIKLVQHYSNIINPAKRTTRKGKQRAIKNKKFYRGWLLRATRNIKGAKIEKIKTIIKQRRLDRGNMRRQIENVLNQ